MLKKILFGALTVLLALSLVGCGAKKDANADKKDAEQKAEVTVEGTADKAVLAYAQLHAYGMVEDENKTAAGLSDADIEKGKEQVLAPIVDTFKDYPLSDESISEMTDKYVEKLHAAMDIKATVKTEDKEHPVVEVTATTINKEGLAKVAAENSDLSKKAKSSKILRLNQSTISLTNSRSTKRQRWNSLATPSKVPMEKCIGNRRTNKLLKISSRVRNNSII